MEGCRGSHIVQQQILKPRVGNEKGRWLNAEHQRCAINNWLMTGEQVGRWASGTAPSLKNILLQLFHKVS